jgi:hypothetical protein
MQLSGPKGTASNLCSHRKTDALFGFQVGGEVAVVCFVCQPLERSVNVGVAGTPKLPDKDASSIEQFVIHRPPYP